MRQHDDDGSRQPRRPGRRRPRPHATLALALFAAAALLPRAAGVPHAAVTVGDALFLDAEHEKDDAPALTRALGTAAADEGAAGGDEKNLPAAAGEADGQEEATATATELVAEAQEELSRDSKLVTSLGAEIEQLQSLYDRVFHDEGTGDAGMASSSTASARHEQEEQQQSDREQLKAEIARIQASVARLMGNLNETQRDLTQAHEAMAQEKVRVHFFCVCWYV